MMTNYRKLKNLPFAQQKAQTIFNGSLGNKKGHPPWTDPLLCRFRLRQAFYSDKLFHTVFVVILVFAVFTVGKNSAGAMQNHSGQSA